MARTQCWYKLAVSNERRQASRSRSRLRLLTGRPSRRCTGSSSEAGVARTLQVHSGKRPAVATESRPSNACARRAFLQADATNAARRLPGTDDWHTVATARASAAVQHESGPCCPATDHGSRMRHPIDSSHCAPTRRQAMVWYMSQPLVSRLRAGSGVSTCTAPSVCCQYWRTASSVLRAALLPLKRATNLCTESRLLSICVAPCAQPENDFALLSIAELKGNLDRRAGIQRSTGFAGQPHSSHGRRTA